MRRATAGALWRISGPYHFYPRSPCGERLDCHVFWHLLFQFLSTLSLRRATHSHSFQKQVFAISIHALLAESDHWEYWVGGYGTAFLSTLSLRRATTWKRQYCQNPCYFYPRSPCGERLAHFNYNVVAPDFYPRSPCGERQLAARDGLANLVFLSTLSLRRAT